MYEMHFWMTPATFNHNNNNNKTYTFRWTLKQTTIKIAFNKSSSMGRQFNDK